MSIEFHCPNCGKLLRTADSKAGVRARCPQCQQPVIVPDPQAEAAPGDEYDFGEPPPAFDDYDQPAALAPPPITGRRKTCPMCGETVATTATRCPHCGESLAPRRAAAAEDPSQTMAVISLVTGISSLPLAFCCGCFGIPIIATSFICGGMALSQIGRGEATGKGMAIAGLVFGGLATVICIAMFVLNLALMQGEGVFDFD